MGLHDARDDAALAVSPPVAYDKWPETQRRGAEIPDVLPYDDQRAGLLIHIISPAWASDPDLYTGSKFGVDGIKLDKVDKTDISKVRRRL